MNELSNVQRALKAPKDKINGFGNYKYRNAEDILQLVKPLLEADNLSIVMSDDIQLIGNRFFLCATASLVNNEGAALATTHAFAQLDDHKGMTAEQATGAASSYARKYALCGLFAIDDSTNDPDTLAPKQEQPQPAPQAQPQQAPAAAPAQAPQRPALNYAEIVAAVKNATSVAELTKIWKENQTAITTNAALKEQFTARKNELNNPQ